ncbi:hypothetical protein ONZ45_g5568 [Pleurotus djamor]|nr:hypothetical protein ONZ45_g5568 [Pleurotus djamor]
MRLLISNETARHANICKGTRNSAFPTAFQEAAMSEDAKDLKAKNEDIREEGSIDGDGQFATTLATTDIFSGSDPIYQEKARILNDAIQEIGMGSYQWQLFIVTGFGWMADNLWPIVTGLILPPVVNEFNFDGPLLKLGQNIGLLLGAAFWGVGSDIWGLGIFAVVAGASPNFVALTSLAAVWSIGVGGNLPVDSSIFLEFVPATHQYLLTVLSIWWAFGQLLGSLVAWPLIGNFSCPSTPCSRSSNQGWRYFLFAMGGLMLVLWALRFFVFKLYESPKYLMGRGRDEEAVAVVHKLAKHNGKLSSLTLDQLSSVGNVEGLANEKRTVDASAIAVIRRHVSKFGSSHVKALFATRKLAYSTSILIILWALIGLAFPLWVIFLDPDFSFQAERSIRYNSFVTFYFTSNVMYGVLYALSPEVFPTKDRGTGNAITASANRVFGIMSPIIAIYADLSSAVPIFIAGGIFCAAGLIALLLPFEPRGPAMEILWPNIESKILIRQEYVDTLAYLRNKSARSSKASGCVILGQPGIGKAFFLIYVLIDRLYNKEPVALQMSAHYYLLFDDRQVTAHLSDNSSPLWKRRNVWKHPIWMLSNASEHVRGPCDAFRYYTGYIVQASPPSHAHWKGWLKERTGLMYVMDVPSSSEIASIAHILNLDQAKCANIVSQWGPSARIMVSLAREPEQEVQYQRAARSGAWRLSRRPYLLGMMTSPSFDSETLSSLIVFVRPGRDGSGLTNRVHPSPWIPTQYLAELMAKALQTVSAADQTRFFTNLMANSYSLTAAEWLSEAWVHTRFSSGEDIPCTWKGLAPFEHLPAALKPAPATFCRLDEVSPNEPFYWRPSAPDFPGINGVLFDGQAVYAIQATVSREHSTVVTGLQEVKKKLPAALHNGPLRVIFAAVDQEKMIRLMNGEKLLGDVPIGGCVVSLGSQPLLFPGRKFDEAEVDEANMEVDNP